MKEQCPILPSDKEQELIDAVAFMSYEDMLRRIRFTPIEERHPYMNDLTPPGTAFWARWKHLCETTDPAERVAASKRIGW